ncbi:MAG: IMP cyclohydrolase [Saccharofermentanales bacterium]
MIESTTSIENAKNIKNSIYPGRSIIMGFSPSNEKFVQLYWTMGRSENSKNRLLIEEDGNVKTIPKNVSSEITNKNLLIYNLAYQIGDTHIVSNGEQTDTILKYIQNNETFEDALMEWNYENDPPIFTPRISGIADIKRDSAEVLFKFSIIKPILENPEYSSHNVFTYTYSPPGIAYCIHTYDLENECSPFGGVPYEVPCYEDIDEMADFYWNLISEKNRVGMFIKFIDIKSGSIEKRIINRDDISGR